jgi:hypothetical protein
MQKLLSIIIIIIISSSSITLSDEKSTEQVTSPTSLF